MGTPEFSLPSLRILLEREMKVVGVVTAPDRRQGRGLKTRPAPVKELALRHNLPLLQPLKLSDPDFIGTLNELDPHVIAVVAYGGYIPKPILEFPPKGCINVHPSLLPKYRGAAPINWALIEGETMTGVTTIYLDEGWDSGDIILSSEVAINPADNAGSLSGRLAAIGAGLLVKTLDSLVGGGCDRTPQDHEAATFAPKLKKEDRTIDWKQPAKVVYNLVRGLSPHPGAYTYFEGSMLKILRADLHSEGRTDAAGRVIKLIKNEGPVISCSEGAILVRELQPASRKAMKGEEFLRGYRLSEGYDFTAGSGRIS